MARKTGAIFVLFGFVMLVLDILAVVNEGQAAFNVAVYFISTMVIIFGAREMERRSEASP